MGEQLPILSVGGIVGAPHYNTAKNRVRKLGRGHASPVERPGKDSLRPHRAGPTGVHRELTFYGLGVAQPLLGLKRWGGAMRRPQMVLRGATDVPAGREAELDSRNLAAARAAATAVAATIWRLRARHGLAPTLSP